MSKSPVELLSPAGSFDCIQAAIQAGADAIYFGVEQLNMRARSANAFSIADMAEIGAICHSNGIRCYLTLNTIIYGHDIQLLRTILKEAKKQRIDAVIASDFAVIGLCSEMGISLHISTQANVTNMESVLFFSRYADVIVLARELTLKQVKEITREIKRKKVTGASGALLKIEVFIHGALCMATSGKCYLSLHSYNASANRGACLQNCRRTYTVKDTESGEELLIDNEYIMSPKDLCTIDILDQVIDSGVGVLKIEGRSKGAEYVYTVTRCYREALEAVYKEEYTAEKISNWKEELSKVYNRGFWEGYYMGRHLGEWAAHAGSSATEKKIYLGRGSKYYPGIKVGEFQIEAGVINAGDVLMVTGPACGVYKEKMEKLVVNGAEGQKAIRGDKVTFPVPAKVTAKDKLYKIVETAGV